MRAALVALFLTGCTTTTPPPPTPEEQAIRDAVYLLTHQP